MKTTEYDNEASLREAEVKLPFERLIRDFGFGPKNENWKSFDCPFCKKPDKAGIFTATGSDTKLFKCQSASCEANKAMPVVKFFKRIKGLDSDREAFIEYLKLAGVWKEPERKAKSQPEIKLQATNGEGYAVLREFYSRLTLLPEDEKRLFEKRGLTSATVAALGFKSNRRANRRLIQEVSKAFGWEELKASGLWKPGEEQKQRRANAQFCGYVQIAKKPKSLRKKPDDKAVWGWVDQGWCAKCGVVVETNLGLAHQAQCPACGGKVKTADGLLIPYFDDKGELLALRPHKGGANEGTAASAMHIYVPGNRTGQKFPTVVITEGEFKAAALWQSLRMANIADGRQSKQAIGVVALPGIYFAKHIQIRAELHHWLRLVGCRLVIVAYDHEDKGNPAFKEIYQPEPALRFSAQSWARYLAMTLAKTLRIRAKVCVLPKDWQINGKADWDGALAMLIKNKEKPEST